MRILVCVKRVPAPGARINISADAQEVDTAHLAFTTSPHEECAVEAAAQLVEQHGGEATVLTLGPPEAEEQLRYAVSVGMAKAVLLPISDGDWDPQRTAQAVDALAKRNVTPARITGRQHHQLRAPQVQPGQLQSRHQRAV